MVLPRVGIVIAVYNSEEHIEKCIESVLNQTYTNIEMCLVDDGSTDNSGKICDQYASKHSNIKVIHKANEGCSRARLTGINEINSDLIGFVDSDDWIESTMISEMLSNYDKNIDILVGGYVVEDGVVKNPFIRANERLYNSHDGLIEMFKNKHFNWSMCDKLYTRELLLKLNDNDYMCNSYGEDTYKNYHLFLMAKEILYKPIYKYHYVVNYSSMMHKEFNNDRFNIIEIYDQIIKEAKENNNIELLEVIPELLINFGMGCLKEFLSLFDNTDRVFQHYLQLVIKDLRIGICNPQTQLRAEHKIQWLEKSKEERNKIYENKIAELKKNYRNIWLYGAGLIAKELMIVFDRYDIDYSIVVSKRDESISRINNHTVYELMKVKDAIAKEDCFVLAMKKNNVEDVKEILLKQGFYNTEDFGKYSYYYL